jgi:hypothetical protein
MKGMRAVHTLSPQPQAPWYASVEVAAPQYSLPAPLLGSEFSCVLPQCSYVV